jgi:hypothetical protein
VRSTASSKERSSEERTEGEEIATKLEHLLSDMAHDCLLQPIPGDDSDVKDYNAELKRIGPLTWQDAPWLYLECYLYRLIYTFFRTSSTEFWRDYDVFANQKNSSIPASKAGTIELITAFLQTLTVKDADDATRHTLLEEMLEISLWGNATDLSLLTTISMEELHSRQGKAAREASKKNVIVDDTEAVWDLLNGMLKKEVLRRSIHIVLDNSGFELLTDLVLAVYLLSSTYATDITLHGKRMPWFVSDVTDRDLHYLIDGLMDGSIFDGLSEQEADNLHQFGSMLRGLLLQGTMKFEADAFWTTQHSFDRMSHVAPDLFSRLSEAELVVFKGDLNYRKLVADKLWPKTTGFREALGSLGHPDNGKGLRTLALRGCKADVVVGLQEGQVAALDQEMKDWTRTGKYAVISYCNAKDS